MRMLKWSKCFTAILLMAVLLLAVGCEEAPVVPGLTAPEVTEPVVPDGAESLEALRQEMEEAGAAFAAAHLGDSSVVDYELCVDVQEVVDITAPLFWADYPFLGEISEERIVGETRGQLFCVVPRDPASTVTVYRSEFYGSEYDQLLYEAESGEPIFVFCNYTGWGADTEITITDSEGQTTVWYPDRNEINGLQISQEDVAGKILDITPYNELLALRYQQILGPDDNWFVPTAEDLLDTTWSWCGYLPLDRYVEYEMTFNDEALLVRFTDGYEDVMHTYEAPWSLEEKDGFAVLIADFGTFAGELRYNILLNEEYRMLYTMVDVTGDPIEPGYENLFCYMDLAVKAAPEVMDMVGTWERFQLEIEGYAEEDTSGACTVVISGSTEENLEISYNETGNSHRSYENKTLIIQPGELYTNCGNDSWYAEVDYVGAFETIYSITLLEDGTLLLRNFYYLDGAPTVSHEMFRRID